MIVGLGIDIVGVPRMERLLVRHHDRFLARWFDPRELPTATSAERIAARWAAKEAAAKALGSGFADGVVPSQIAILALPSGAPTLQLSGDALRRAQALGATRFHVSLSHADGVAVATVILESDCPNPRPPTPDPGGNG